MPAWPISRIPSIGLEALTEIVPGPDFPDRRADHRQGGRARGPDARARLGADAGQDRHRGDPQGSLCHHRPRIALSGEQGAHAGTHGRAGARQARRGHCRYPRRKRPARHARGHRAEARCLARGRAEPALPLLRTADELRRQHAGAQRRQAGADESEGHDRRLRRLPRGGRHPAHALRSDEGARTRPHPGRSGGRGRQYRRGDPPDPRRPRCRDRARAIDGARLAGEGCRPAGRTDRRSASRHHAARARSG